MAEAPREYPQQKVVDPTLSRIVTDIVQPEEANRWKGINTHTHIYK